MSRTGMSPYAASLAKRAFDLSVAIPMLILTSPLLLVAMMAVGLTSPGPPIFSQQRVGLNRKSFQCHKLRSMVSGTASVPTHEASKSSVTPVGRILRATKIDELPQLWNVVRGEMSLVGPRPCLPSQSELIEARVAQGAFDIRPGITGLAQVNGVDMSTPIRLAEVDGSYLRHASPGGDFVILLRTVVGRR